LAPPMTTSTQTTTGETKKNAKSPRTTSDPSSNPDNPNKRKSPPLWRIKDTQKGRNHANTGLKSVQALTKGKGPRIPWGNPQSSEKYQSGRSQQPKGDLTTTKAVAIQPGLSNSETPLRDLGKTGN